MRRSRHHLAARRVRVRAAAGRILEWGVIACPALRAGAAPEACGREYLWLARVVWSLAAVVVGPVIVRALCCAACQMLVLQVPLQSDISEYDAVWYPSNEPTTPWLFSSLTGGPYPTETWSETQVSYGPNNVYDVPGGDGAWFVAYGATPGACTSQPGMAQAWGVIADSCPLGPAADLGAGPIAYQATSKHCTATKVRCVSTGAPPPTSYLCEVVVADVNRHPTEPTGAASLTISSPSSSPPGASETISCSLKGRPSGWGVCFFSPPSNLGVDVVIAATYPGDATHNPSGSTPYHMLTALQPPFHDTTAAEKAALKVAADDESLAADTGAGTVLVLGALGGPISAPVSLAAGLTWATVKIDSGLKKYEANHIDPVDLRYASVARPRVVALPPLPVLPGSVGSLTRALLANVLTANAIAQVLGTSENRATTAAVVSDGVALNRQRQAIARYFDDLANITLSDIAVEKRLAAALQRAHLDLVTISPGSVNTIQRRSGRLSPPRYLLRLLMAAESRTVAVGEWRALAQLAKPGTVRLSSMFTNAQLISEERQVAAILRADAHSN